MTIPAKVFDVYATHADDMLNLSGFGAQCKLVFMSQVEVVDSVSPLKQKKVMNLQGSSNDYGRANKSFKSVEVTEDITLRIYWSEKDFKKVSSVSTPDGAIMTIGSLSDISNVNKAIALIINTDKTNLTPYRFTKIGEPIIHGLNNNYFTCFWGRD